MSVTAARQGLSAIDPERNRYVQKQLNADFVSGFQKHSVTPERDCRGRKYARISLEFNTPEMRDAFLFQTLAATKGLLHELKQQAFVMKDLSDEKAAFLVLKVRGSLCYDENMSPNREVDLEQDKEEEVVQIIRELTSTSAVGKIGRLIEQIFSRKN